MLNCTEVDPGSRLPQKGDLTICAYCATVYQFDEDLSFQPIPEGFLDTLKEDERAELQEMQDQIRRSPSWKQRLN